MAKIIFDLNGTIVKEILGQTQTIKRYVLFEGIFELLTELKERGHELFLWTMASRKTASELLEYNKIDIFFTKLQTIENGFYKPDPVGVKKLIGNEGFIIGDSSGDMEAGIKAGITSIAALWGQELDANIGIQNNGILYAQNPLDILNLI